MSWSGRDEPGRHAVPAPAPGPADVGIVAALSIEIGPLLDRLARVRTYAGPRQKVLEGELAGKVVAVVIAGPGRTNAQRATQVLLAGHRPGWILSAGFAGALDPGLRRNDVVCPTEILSEDGGRWPIEPPPPVDPGPRLIASGRLLTVDRIIRTAAEKAALRERFQADLVDMETSAVAAACVERSARFLAIRVVSDEAGTDLPPEIVTILGRSGGYRMGATLGALWRRPSSIKDLWRLREHAMDAADRLALVLATALPRLT